MDVNNTQETRDTSGDLVFSIVKTHPVGAALFTEKGDNLHEVNHLSSEGQGQINGESASSGERTRNNCPSMLYF